MTTSPRRLAGALAVAVLLTTGCGAAAGTAGLDTLGLRGFNADGPRKGPGIRPGGHGRAAGPRMAGFGLPGLAGLDLTAEQRAQLRTIAEKHRPAADPEARKAEREGAMARHAAVKAAIEAEPFDAAALEQALKAATPASRARGPKPEMLAEMWAVLTEAQRAKAIERLEAQPARPAMDRPAAPKGADRLAARLKLTEAQRAALDAVVAARPIRKPGDHKAAMIAFLKTGDASQLTPPSPPSPPVAEMVAFVAGLDAGQRKALAALPHLLFGGGPGKHGGHGKHAGPRKVGGGRHGHR